MERLVAKSIEEKKELNIKIFDPFSIGGRVWDPRIEKNKTMLMNTVSSQVTMFVDDSIKDVGLIVRGPSLYEWMQNEASGFININPEFEAYRNQLNLGAGDYPSRGLVGIYELWFFQKTLERMPNNVTVRFLQDKVIRLNKKGKNIFVETESGENNEKSDFVVVATGHAENKLNKEESSLNIFAKKNDLLYIPAGHPAESILDSIHSKENLIIRGLGLSFFDFIGELSSGLGGTFKRDSKGILKYKKSGSEPIIFAGSRSGMTLQARGVNAKEPSELYKPEFFTIKNINLLKQSNGKILFNDFYNLFDKEIQFKHYSNVANDPDFRNLVSNSREMLNTMKKSDSKEFSAIANKHNIPQNQIWDWNLLLNGASTVDKKDDLKKWYLKFLDDSIADSKKNNIAAPFSGAFDIIRDIRDTVRYVIENDYFETQEYVKFTKKFTPINVLLSVGPPLLRVEQLRALIKADVLTILGPELEIATDLKNKSFIAKTKRGEKIKAKQLLEARLSPTNIKDVKEPLQKQLLFDEMIVPVTLTQGKKPLTIGAIDINRDSFLYINSKGRQVQNIYSFGIPHEGLKWFETVIPRPGVNTVVLREAVQISNNIFNKISNSK